MPSRAPLALFQIDNDLSNTVWTKMDEADPTSPFSCFGGKKNKSKRAGDNGGSYAGLQQERDHDATIQAAKEYGLLWRMWRVTKPLVRFMVQETTCVALVWVARLVLYEILEAMYTSKYVPEKGCFYAWNARIAVPDFHLGLFSTWVTIDTTQVISQGLWQLLATLTEFVPSIAMQQIIDFVSKYDKEGGKVTGRITFFVVLLFVGPIVQGLADGRNFHTGRRIGCRVRGSLVGSIFRKMLIMDTASSTYSSGQLTNLVSVDAQSVLEYSSYTHFIWATSLQASACVQLLRQRQGAASS